MKKIIVSFIASLACLQSAHALPAAPSNLNESIREYQAILNADMLIDEVIPQSEFIFDIRRITRNIEASVVFYIIKTRVFPGIEDIENTIELQKCAVSQECNGRKSHSHHHRVHRYSVKLLITPNPEIGPPIITVERIRPIGKHSSCSHESEERNEG